MGDFGIIGHCRKNLRPYSGQASKVWFYEIENDGFSKGTQRRPTPDKNDIPDLLSKWPKRLDSEKSWLVNKKKIEENDFILTASSYKLNSVSTTSFRESKKILQEIKELDKSIKDALQKINNEIE